VKRKLFMVLSAGSLILCLATVVLWVRSYARADRLEIDRYGDLRPGDVGETIQICVVFSTRGGIRVEVLEQHRARWTFTSPRNETRFSHRTYIATESAVHVGHTDGGTTEWKGVGIAFGEDNSGKYATGGLRFLVLPYWLPVGLTAAGSVPVFVLWKRRRRPAGYCGRCSYNLTGNTSGVCPECGTALARKEVA
jgi:hypothetical protein